jgi:hypothetical protein
MTNAARTEVPVSTHADPSKDEYLELEKKVGANEVELAADLARADHKLDAVKEKGKKKVSAARKRFKPKTDAKSRTEDPDGIQRYSLEAAAGRSDLTGLPELVRGQLLSHR